MSLCIACASVISVCHLIVIAYCQSVPGTAQAVCDLEYRTKYGNTENWKAPQGQLRKSLLVRPMNDLSYNDVFNGRFRNLLANAYLAVVNNAMYGGVNGDRLSSIPGYSYGRRHPPVFFHNSPKHVKYSFYDTFNRMNQRRGGSPDFEVALRKAAWSEDNCKSMRRIVGGYQIDNREELPFVAFLDNGCGGSIINDTWVLTANHCVEDDVPQHIYVGSLRLLGGCRHQVEKIIQHPNYTATNMQNDVALIKVSPPFVFSPAIKPISLARKTPRRKSCGIATGWGAKMYRGALSNELMMAMIPVVSKRRCKMFAIRRGQFCAGYKHADMDSCQGDSGGPFVINGLQVGIVSFGYKCATPNVPGVYVDVAHHWDWIKTMAI